MKSYQAGKILFLLNLFLCVCVRACMCPDGAPDSDAEPDERAADGDADRLVQRVSEILWQFLCGGHSGTNCRVRF